MGQEMKILKRCTKKSKAKKAVAMVKGRAYDDLYARLKTKEGEKELYRLARQRDRAGKDVQHMRVMKDEYENVMINLEAVLKKWKEYFEKLYIYMYRVSVKLLYSLTSYYTVRLYSNFTDTLYIYIYIYSGATRNYQRGMAIKIKKTFFRHSIFAKLKIPFFHSPS